MKKILLFIALASSVFSFAQNVGIGTNTPSQKLDVNGNMNVSGNITVNNVAGQPNQVLMTNNSGNTFWGNYYDYKYAVSFPASPAGGTWQIPAGVTKIMIECWGGGGGGASGGGGGSGGYARQTYSVTPLNLLTISVGIGGPGAPLPASFAGDGNPTSVTGPGVNITAFQGYGAGATDPGQGSFNAGSETYVIINGNNGYPTTETYVQRSATEFATIRKYGDGAKSVLYNSHEGRGAAFAFNTATLINISLINANFGTAAGAGGGGGPYAGNWGANGARGLVIIHY